MLVQEKASPADFHCELTPAGVTKLQARENSTELDDVNEPHKFQAGVDYVVKDQSNDPWWLPFPDRAETKGFRHNWVIKRRRRPRDPSFQGCALPYAGDREQERTARIVQIYFRPWTAWKESNDNAVLKMTDIYSESWDWSTELLTWLDGNVLTLEMERCVRNFFIVVQA